ncbi:ion channel [Flavobacterium succinicans]|uniref:Inward rectifier potassium channel n=1 Tax=Flavobacterium succinicans TaxID=29536 RepID=A0A199XU68_9FLAO|nr:ion channel [Flavobacterium succinicans]OAZ04786.1 inward rectifier potassium channel [Flavobacterium succinicans]
MALFKRLNSKLTPIINTGFGTNATLNGKRFLNKDGNARVKRLGLSFFESNSWYHTLLDMPTWKFLGVLLLFYMGINFVFACLYFAIGIEHLNGIATTQSQWEQFGQAYFFSAQTFTTVGYGHISPVGFMTSALSAAEALIGLLSFAIATGLFFGRFSKPRVYLKFSDNAIIAPYQNGTALMFRMAPYKNTNYLDTEVDATIGLSIEEDGVLTNKFYTLDLEINKVNTLVLSWTIVHPITDKSPLYQFTEEDFANVQGEILVFVKTFDDMYSTTVATRTSYIFPEVVYGAKFKSMFESSAKHTHTLIHLDDLNTFEKVML